MEVKEIRIAHHGRCNIGDLYLPEGTENCPLIIMSHGYNGHKSDFEKAASYFAKRGIASYIYTFCGGSSRDESGFPTTSMSIFTEVEDLNAVLDAALTWERIDKQKIFLFGASQGGLVSTLTAEDREKDIEALILLFPALCIADDWNKKFSCEEEIPEELEFWGMNLGKAYFSAVLGYDVFEHIGKFEKKVLVMHGDQDAIVSLDYSKRMEKLYKDLELEVFEGEGHGFTPESDQKMIEMIYEFMCKMKAL